MLFLLYDGTDGGTVAETVSGIVESVTNSGWHLWECFHWHFWGSVHSYNRVTVIGAQWPAPSRGHCSSTGLNSCVDVGL